MKVVTSGYPFLDIDAYGGCIAYAELLNLGDDEAIAATTAPLNESITPTIKSWEASMVRDYDPFEDDEYILIDLSDPAVFDRFVDVEKVTEIIDHHMDFADYWQAKLGNRAHIEFVGAACTLVYERWQQAGKLPEISTTSARLLMAGILDNTLNFEASVTTPRDRDAYAALAPFAKLPNDWAAQYFEECQQNILNDLRNAIINDSKVIAFPSRSNDITVGQLVLWDAKGVVAKDFGTITGAMPADAWFMNVISIAEGCNYLIAKDAGVQQFLEQLLGVTFSNSVATTNRLWLRKEIIKADMDAAQ